MTCYNFLLRLSISSFFLQLYVFTIDNASSNKRMLPMISWRIKGANMVFIMKRHVPCVARIINSVVQLAKSLIITHPQ